MRLTTGHRDACIAGAHTLTCLIAAVFSVLVWKEHGSINDLIGRWPGENIVPPEEPLWPSLSRAGARTCSIGATEASRSTYPSTNG
jgi:hypothetical protein